MMKIMLAIFGAALIIMTPSGISLEPKLQKRIPIEKSSIELAVASAELVDPDEVCIISQTISKEAKQYGLDPFFVFAVIDIESKFDSHAVSSTGVKGIMQLERKTFAAMGGTKAFDPEDNIKAGVRYLARLSEQFKRPEMILLAYNAGPYAAIQHSRQGRLANPHELSYSSRVIRRYNKVRELYEKTRACYPNCSKK